MKKILFSIFTILTIQSTIAGDNLVVYSNGVVLYKQDISKIDSIVFEKSIGLACAPSVSQVVIGLGPQTWTTTNLNVDKFRNGDVIPEAKTDEEWTAASTYKTPAWCYLKNSIDSGLIYGKLYNHYAVNDSRGLAPQGWHVPSDAEWTNLTTYFGGETVAGTKLKNTCGWYYGVNGSNTSGFAGLPGGTRGPTGKFYNIGTYGSWWSSSQSAFYSAWSRYLGSSNGTVNRDDYNNKGTGLSVRCVKD